MLGTLSSTTLFPAAQPTSYPDFALGEVEVWLSSQPEWEATMAASFRRAFDEVLDGQRTGRYDFSDLSKVEKTYLGTKVEIILRAAFDLERGGKKEMDYVIAGHPVDCKWSMSKGGWMIPKEAVGHLCLLTWASDQTSQFSVGLVRANPEHLKPGQNQDGKKSLNALGQSHIRWLVQDGQLLENLLLHLDDSTRSAILTPSSGQERVNKLFCLVPERIVNREVVLAVGKQDDSPKRVRDARKHLRPQGIRILGHQNPDPGIARRLGLPVPRKGQWVSYQPERYGGVGAET